MTAIYKEPGAAPRIIDIDNTLEALQAAVGGYVESLTLCTDLVLLCNEEGRINDMAYNCTICGEMLFGPILLVGADGDNFVDIPKPERVGALVFGKEVWDGVTD